MHVEEMLLLLLLLLPFALVVFTAFDHRRAALFLLRVFVLVSFSRQKKHDYYNVDEWFVMTVVGMPLYPKETSQ
jgi:hypothetical protein